MSEKATSYDSVVVDTVNQMMNDVFVEYSKEKGKPGFDQWRDYSIELLSFYHFIRSLPGAIIVQVSGLEGTGKSCGARTLNPLTTMYLNCDRKPLTFTDAEEMYPPNLAEPNKPNSRLNYKEVWPEKNEKNVVEPWTVLRKAVQYAYDRKIGDKFVVFVLTHIEVYEGADGVKRERLKTLGKSATKLNIEGSLVYCFYAKVDPHAPTRSERYKLTMHSSGFNTARVPMGLFEDVEEIPNDFQLILDRIYKRKTKTEEI